MVHALLRFERAPFDARLANDGVQRTNADLGVIRHRNGYGSARRFLLHDDVAPLSANLFETVFCQDRADLSAR
jgi:hypothetical protein